MSSDNEELIIELKSWLARKEYDDDEKIRAVTAIFDALNIRESTANIVEEYFSKGIDLLEKLSAPSSRKTELKNLITKTMKRES